MLCLCYFVHITANRSLELHLFRHYLGGVRTTNKKTNLRTYEPPLGYDSSFFGLPDTRDGQNKKRSAQNKKAELEKRSL